MNIFGEEYGFMLTVGASTAIARLCPDGDLNRMNEVLNGTFADAITFSASFIVAMANGYDDAKRFIGEEVTHKPLTLDMVMALPGNIFAEVQAAALAAFGSDINPTVEIDTKKKTEAEG